MNDVQNIELRALCETLENARLSFECQGMMNTRTDPVERAAQSFAYEAARIAYWRALEAVREFRERMA